MQLLRRADREAEGARLLSEYAPKGHLGFESPALRQLILPKGPYVGPFCFCRNVSWGFEPERVRASSKRGAFVARRQEGRQAFAAGGVAEQPRTSPALRQLILPKGPYVGPFCFCRNVSWGFEPERVRASSKRGAFVARRQEGRQAFAAGGVFDSL